MNLTEAEVVQAIEHAVVPTPADIIRAKRLILDALTGDIVDAAVLQDLLLTDADLPIRLDRRHAVDVRRWNGRTTDLTALRQTRFWRAGNRALIDLLAQGIVIRQTRPRTSGESRPVRQAATDIPIIGTTSPFASVIAPVVTMTGTCSLSPRYASATAWLADPDLFTEHLGPLAEDSLMRTTVERTLVAHRADAATSFAISLHQLIDVGWSSARRALGLRIGCDRSSTASRDAVLIALGRSYQLADSVDQLATQNRRLSARLESIVVERAVSDVQFGRGSTMGQPAMLSDTHRLLTGIAAAIDVVTGHDLSAA